MKVNDWITREMIEKHQIVVYSLTDITASLLFEWSNDIQQVLEHWPKNHPYLAIHDLSYPGVAMSFLVLSGRDIYSIDPSPLGRKRASGFIQDHPDMQFRLALVLSTNLSGDVTRRYGRTKTTDQFQQRVFSSREQAIAWLMESVSLSGLGLTEAQEDDHDSDQ